MKRFGWISFVASCLVVLGGCGGEEEENNANSGTTTVTINWTCNGNTCYTSVYGVENVVVAYSDNETQWNNGMYEYYGPLDIYEYIDGARLLNFPNGYHYIVVMIGNEYGLISYCDGNFSITSNKELNCDFII